MHEDHVFDLKPRGECAECDRTWTAMDEAQVAADAYDEARRKEEEG